MRNMKIGRCCLAGLFLWIVQGATAQINYGTTGLMLSLIHICLFEKKFVAGYQFMKVERNGADTVYRIAWKDVVLILENPIVKTLKIR